MIASQRMRLYFENLKNEIMAAFQIATQARQKGLDPEEKVEISLVSTMAERVVGLISVIAPQVSNTNIAPRIEELESIYGVLDWRVALKIAEEIALEKFCKFSSQKEAMEVGIRTGFAYLTLGSVSSPLDGLVGINFRRRMDGRGEYLSLDFAGPIRNAGGTAAAVCVLIADHVRKKFGYDVYDAQQDEVNRARTELLDYHERVTNLQYVPSEQEIEFLLPRLPVEIDGEPSEKIEVSNYKNLPRVSTNLIRSGYCLVLSACIPLKAPKLWAQLSKWGEDFGLEHWGFLEAFIKIQKSVKAGGEKKDSAKISPDNTYLADLVAGRPILAYPLRLGGFRLRYGRSRASGYSSVGVHPATMAITNNYIAACTQLKLERPSKGGVAIPCDTIEGPIVLLDDGTVKLLDDIKEAKVLLPRIVEILYLGDILISYGDFYDRAHQLVPAGYCEEWWAQEVEKATVDNFGALDFEKAAVFAEVNAKHLESFVKNPFFSKPNAHDAVLLSKKLGIALHPAFCYHWRAISVEDMLLLIDWVSNGTVLRDDAGSIQKLVLELNANKKILESIGLPHAVASSQFVTVDKDHAASLLCQLGLDNGSASKSREKVEAGITGTTLEALHLISEVPLRDKSGTFIGARMGRPEKAKMRELTGSPQVLFPVGEEGGRFRSVNAAVGKGTVNAEFAHFACSKCNRTTVFSVCPECSTKAKRVYYCSACGWIESQQCSRHGPAAPCKEMEVDLRRHFNAALAKLKMEAYPELIKGVRGTSNKEHIPEHLCKGILRAKHGITVNKDGTSRYDMTQAPITHFKPKEIGTSVEILRKLGYKQDILGRELEGEEQILELYPQDIILPACPESPDENAGAFLMKVAGFIDDLLEHFYDTNPFYNIRGEEGFVGQLVVCLAPHTSAGIVGRIIGFSKTQGFFAHPLLHAATRRDCDGDEACIILLMDAMLNFSRKYLPNTRGATMDAPLVLSSTLDPTGVDDMVFNIDVCWHYPLELYEAALAYKMPWAVNVSQLKHALGTERQLEGFGFTHDTGNINHCVRCSAYKLLPKMEDKLKGQMELAERIRAVDKSGVARMVIEKHFIKDAKGNLRKFSTQEFRCIDCNEKYRRPPLAGHCLKCKGRLVFTVSEGNIVKYIEPMMSLAKKYEVSPYLIQTIELLQRRVEGVFGKEKDKQSGLGAWFG